MNIFQYVMIVGINIQIQNRYKILYIYNIMDDLNLNIKDVVKRKGVFGFGLSNNVYMNLLNLVVLAYSGIIIKIFFQENYTKLGNSGPASTTIWGFGLTALALFIMIFMSIGLSSENEKNKSHLYLEDDSALMTFIKIIMNNTLPVVFTFILVMYMIILNFIYYTRINSNKITDTYVTYSFFSSVLLIIQISVIVKYMFDLVYKKHILKPNTNKITQPNTNEIIQPNTNKIDKEINLIKSLSYILIFINFILVIIKHILLAFFSTDG